VCVCVCVCVCETIWRREGENRGYSSDDKAEPWLSRREEDWEAAR